MLLKNKILLVLIICLLFIVGCSGKNVPGEVINEVESKCSNIDHPADVDVCILDLANENNNVDTCLLMNYEDNKYACKAQLKKDSSLCDKVVNEIDAYFCVIYSEPDKADPTFCDGVDEFNKEICYTATAIKKKNSEFCKKIENEILRDLCFEDVEKIKR